MVGNVMAVMRKTLQIIWVSYLAQLRKGPNWEPEGKIIDMEENEFFNRISLAILNGYNNIKEIEKENLPNHKILLKFLKDIEIKFVCKFEKKTVKNSMILNSPGTVSSTIIGS
jgi:hypothetical protein